MLCLAVRAELLRAVCSRGAHRHRHVASGDPQPADAQRHTRHGGGDVHGREALRDGGDHLGERHHVPHARAAHLTRSMLLRASEDCFEGKRGVAAARRREHLAGVAICMLNEDVNVLCHLACCPALQWPKLGKSVCTLHSNAVGAAWVAGPCDFVRRTLANIAEPANVRHLCHISVNCARPAPCAEVHTLQWRGK